jgi:uncharacterized protein
MNAGRAWARRFRIRWVAVAASCAIALGALARPAAAQDSTAAGIPPIPQPTGYVVDQADVIDATTEDRLQRYLDQLETRTGVEFAVLTMPTTAPMDPLQYKTQVYQQWGGHREGLLMLVAMEERTIAFETGYEVEGTLPDGLQARIIRQQMVPRFRAGDVSGGIVAGVIECAERIAKEKGVTLEWGEGRPQTVRSERRKMPLWLMILIFVLILIVVSRASGGGGGGRRRRGGGWWIGPGMGGLGGGWGGWTGGLGGGGFGGSSGGGGSFGGFGGGFGSGGGGGSGRW